MRDRTLKELANLKNENQEHSANESKAAQQPQDEKPKSDVTQSHTDDQVETLSFQETTPEGATLQADGQKVDEPSA